MNIDGNGGGLRLTDTELFENDVEDRRQEDAEDRQPDHAGEYGDTHGVTHFGAGTRRGDQRENARDEGDRGHEDRAEPETRRLEGGFNDALAFFPQLDGELHDQDRVLGRETDEH